MKRKVLIIVSLGLAGQMFAQAPQILGIEDYRRMALEHNIDLQIARESVNAAHQAKEAMFTQFLPNISANGLYTYNQKNISLLSEDGLLPVGTKMADGSFGFTADQVSNQWTMINGQPVPLDANGVPFDPSANPEKILWKNYALLPKESMEFDIHNVFVGGLNLTQPLYLGGKIRELYRISQYAEQMSQDMQDNKATEMLIQVDEAYWRVVSLENKVGLAKEYRNLVANLDTNITYMYEEGTATKADELKVRVKLNESDVALTKATNGLALSRMALNQLCGLPLNDSTQLADQDLTGQVVIPAIVPIDSAIENRPEIKMLTQADNIAKSNQRLMLSRFLPNIALSANYLISNPNVYNGFENEFAGAYSIGIAANIPITHFGDRFHTMNAAKIEKNITSLKLKDAREKIALQISQGEFNSNESLKKQLATEENLSSAEENLRTANEGFAEGMVTSSDLLGAQTAWLSARSEYIDATIEARLNSLYLQKALGTLKAPEITSSELK
jgi:outer membrane protein